VMRYGAPGGSVLYRYILPLFIVAAFSLCTACGSGGSASQSQQIKDLQATVAALQRAGTQPPTVSAPPVRTAAPTNYKLTGKLTAPERCDNDDYSGGSSSGYRIIGANVTVKNEAGEIVASTVTTVDPDMQGRQKQADDIFDQAKALSDQAFPLTTARIKAAGALSTPGPRETDLKNQSDLLYAQGRAIQACVVDFTTVVPIAKFYQARVGTHDAPAYSFDEMLAQNFAIQLSLK
jgi:hypothetical protein